MPSFSRDQTMLLISLYENFPCLYQADREDYKNKTKRSQALKQITKSLCEFSNMDFTEEDVKKKIHGLRTQYMAEVAKIKKYFQSGMARESVYKRHLWCFEHLHFLKERMLIKREKSNEDVAISDNDESLVEPAVILYDGPVENINNATQETEQPKLKEQSQYITTNSATNSVGKKRRLDTNFVLYQKTKALEEHINDKDDEYECFGKYIASEMRNIKDKTVLCKLKRIIVNTIYDAQEEKL